MIPTRSRQVEYHPPGDSTIPNHLGEPLSATVAWANPEGTLVNLAVLDILGSHHARSGVPFVLGDQERPEAGHFACWPPYVRELQQGVKTAMQEMIANHPESGVTMKPDAEEAESGKGEVAKSGTTDEEQSKVDAQHDKSVNEKKKTAPKNHGGKKH